MIPSLRICSSVGTVLLALSVTAVAAPGSDGITWLTRAFHGATAAYEGVQTTVVYGDTGISETRVRVRGDGRGRELREFVSGPASGTTLLHTPNGRFQKSASGQYVRLPSLNEAAPSARAALVAANYRVTTSSSSRVLGRKATTISISARRPSNPSRTLSVDAATGLILDDTLIAPDGKERSVTRFVELRFGPQPAALFREPTEAPLASAEFGPGSFSARTSESDVRRDTRRPVPLPSYIPDGFRVSAYGVMRAGSGRLTPAVRYGDGLAAFSIFVRGGPQGEGPGPRGRGRGPGPHGFGRAGGRADGAGFLTSQSDRQQATVLYTGRTASYVLIGDIAVDELIRIARSLP